MHKAVLRAAIGIIQEQGSKADKQGREAYPQSVFSGLRVALQKPHVDKPCGNDCINTEGTGELEG